MKRVPAIVAVVTTVILGLATAGASRTLAGDCTKGREGHPICPGSRVMDDERRLGEVFTIVDRDAVVYFDKLNITVRLPAEKLSLRATGPCPSRASMICPGEIVLSGESIVRVEENYENGLALMVPVYAINHEPFITELTSVRTQVKCAGNVCAGRKVMFEGMWGDAMYVFSGGIVVMSRWTNPHRFLDFQRVVGEVPCLDGLCEGDNVEHKSAKTVGRVETIFEDGQYFVDFGGRWGQANYKRDELVKVEYLGR